MKPEVVVTDLTPTSRQLQVEIPASEVRAEYAKACDSIARSVVLPGFRPGRVPPGAIKMKFSRELRSEVLSNLVSHSLSHAVADHKLDVVGTPRIDEAAIELRDGNPLRFTAEVDVVPPFELKPYFGIKLTKRVATISDEQVNEVIDGMRNEAAEFAPIEDRPSAIGDFVTVDIVGKYIKSDPATPPAEPGESAETDKTADQTAQEEKEEKEEEDLATEDLRIELGGDGVQAEFTDNLTGVSVGDVRQFRVPYPEDFTSPGLAGRTLDFTATVRGVHRREIPEFNDDFATGHDHESAAEMRNHIRLELERAALERADSRLREDLCQSLINDNPVELPAGYIDELHRRQAARFYEDVLRNYQRMPFSPEDIGLQIVRLKMIIERHEHISAIFRQIAAAEEISVTDDEIKDELSLRARRAGISIEEMYDRVSKSGSISDLTQPLLNDKVTSRLINNAEIATEQISVEEENRIEEAERTAVLEEVKAHRKAQQAARQSAQETTEEAAPESTTTGDEAQPASGEPPVATE